MSSSRTRDKSGLRLCFWLLRYAMRRWPELLVVLIVMLLKIGLDMLSPWPMKILVDHALGDSPLPPALVAAAEILPGGATRESLIAWSVGATVVLFLLGWTLGLA